MDRGILDEWHDGVRLFHVAHSMAATRNARLHRAFGVPVVIVATVVGTTVFASIGEKPTPALSIVTGLLSIGAAVLSSLQTFLGFSGEAERHKAAAVKYGMLRREIEEVLGDEHSGPESRREFMKTFRTRWDQVDHESPALPQLVHDRAMRHLRQDETKIRQLGRSSKKSRHKMPLRPTGLASE